MRRQGRALLLALALALGLGGAVAGCSEARLTVQDEATCPGTSCTEDARATFEAVAAVEGVAAVDSVSRTYGLDRGGFRSAEVTAEVTGRPDAVATGVEVLRILDGWTEAEEGDALVTVTAEDATMRPETGDRVLSPRFYAPCDPRQCATAVEALTEAIGSVEGVEEVSTDLVGDVLEVRVRTGRSAGQVLTAVLDATETDLDRRVARLVRVEVTSTAPLAVSLRLSEGRVCEQPPGMVVACEEKNSIASLS